MAKSTAGVAVEIRNSSELAKMAKEATMFVASPEGLRALEEAMRQADETLERLREERKISPRILHIPMDV
jgi:hypothetical protein